MYTVLKFQFDRACFQGGGAIANFGGKVEYERKKEKKKNESLVSASPTQTQCRKTFKCGTLQV